MMLLDGPCCPSCSTPYRHGEAACPSCGTVLESVARHAVDFSGFPPLDPHGPPPAGGIFVLEIEGDQPVRFRGRAVSVIELKAGEYMLGRRDLVEGHYPDIDLQDMPHYGYTSRRHARLIVRDGQLFVIDIKGDATTAINDPQQPLAGGSEVELQEGDRLIIGEAVTFHVRVVNDD